MRRLLLAVATAASVLATAACLALWARSAGRLDAVICHRSRPSTWWVVQTFPHGLAVRRVVPGLPVLRFTFVADPLPAGDGWQVRSGPWMDVDEVFADAANAGGGNVANRWPAPAYFWSPPDRWWHGFGYEWPSAATSQPSDRVTAVYVPFAAVLPATLAVPAARAASAYRRRHRRIRGRCPRCAYDLRSSPGRCPECGAVASGRR